MGKHPGGILIRCLNQCQLGLFHLKEQWLYSGLPTLGVRVSKVTMGRKLISSTCHSTVPAEQDLRILPLLSADGYVLLASSDCDLQHILRQFAAECQEAKMRISNSKFEAVVLILPQ